MTCFMKKKKHHLTKGKFELIPSLQILTLPPSWC